MSKFKKLINRGDRVVGIWQTIPSLQLCHTIIRSGVDFIVFDMEHSVFDFRMVLEHSLLCRANNIGAVVRISHFDKHLISLAYDVGVDVIQIPNIKTLDEVQKIHRFTSYEIEKGFSPFTVSEDYIGVKNMEKPLISIHIENREVMDGLEKILQLNEVDIFFFGLFDISRSFDLLGDVRNPKIINEVKKAMKKVIQKGKTVGFIINEINHISDFGGLGTYITYASDVLLMKRNLGSDTAKLKAI